MSHGDEIISIELIHVHLAYKRNGGQKYSTIFNVVGIVGGHVK